MGRNGEWLGSFLGVFSLSLTGHLVNARPCAVPSCMDLITGNSPFIVCLQSVLIQAFRITAGGPSAVGLASQKQDEFHSAL